MEIDVKHTKQRNKRRERAQRMQAERDKDADGVGIVDSADEDSKPIRPPQRRKKANLFKEPSPILEEDVVDGFAILSFKTYEDLEYAIKLANKRNEKRLSAITELTTIMLEDKLPKIDTGQIKEEGDGRDREREWNYKNNNHHTNNIAFNHDPGTSDDSGRASERLTTSSVAQRDQDSSRDRLSDASSRCSSGKGYICDSEGDDDKASDGGSTTTASTSAAVVPRKSIDTFPTIGVPLANGVSVSPLSPCPPTNNSGSAPPAPSPAPAALPPPSLPYTSPSPLQVTNEPLNTHLTSLPNHVGSHQSNGQTTSTTATIPNGKVPSSVASSTVNNKIPSTSASTSTSLSSPNAKQSMASSPSATSPIGGVAVANTTTTASSKKHSPTISNLLAPTTSTASSTTVPVSTNSVTAIPSPVSSTSSLSSISIPSRLGSSTPPVTTPTGNTNVTNTPSSSVATPTTNLQSPAISTQPQMHPHPGLEHTMQQLGNSPLLSSHPAALGLPPSLNGPGSMPHHLMGLGSLGPLGHMPYRAIYPYGPLYSPYGMPHHPYGAMPPTPIPPSALSPRSLENRRDSSPLVLSKPIKPITPNSNSQPSNNSQSSSNSTTPAGPNTATTISPRSFSPREKDSFSVNSLSSKSSAATPGSSVIPQSPLTAHPSSSSLLAPYVNVAGQPLTAASSASGIYPSSSLPYPAKIPSLIAPPSSWPHPSAHPSSVSSPVTTIAGQRQTQSIPASNTSSPFTATPSFTAPLPPPPAVPTTVASVNSLPFSAESLLTNKPDQTDLLRRELDSRFLDRSGMGVPTSQSNQSSVASAMPTSSAPSTQTSSPGSANQAASLQQSPSSNLPFLRQELHHHQHQHTHLHQHQHQHQGILPTAPAGSLFPPPLFKDIPKIGAGDSPFYRTAPLMGMPPYSAYPSGMLHPGLSGPTQFVPPSHLQSFVPKQQGPPAVVDPTKPKQVKTGRWNAMHVRIAWEIYHHQAKQNPDKASSAGGIKTENMLRPHMYVPPPSPNVRQHELTTPSGFPQTPPSLQGRPFDPLSPNFLGTPSGLGVSPFGRYASPFASPFSGLSPYSRELPMGAGPLDPWRSPLSRSVGGYPPTSLASNWGSMKPDPGLDAARREAEERERQMREREERERERQRREREDRERKEREREEKLRKEQQEREQRERERERKEKERREMERREMERERMLQQQRLNDNAKAVRDRSPLRNGDSDIRIKEEPRKDEQEMMMRADPRYQMAAAWQMGRHPAHMLPPPHLSRQGMLPPGSLVGLPPHYATAPGWPSPLDPYRDYRLMDPMMRSYQIPNPMLDAMRAEEAKAYAQASAMYANRGKVPSPQPGHPPTVPSPHHHRMPPNGPMGKPPSIIPSPLGNDMHKKEDAPR